MDDTDLNGLDLEGARAYLVDFATNAKMLRKDLATLDAELDTWRKRVTLATEKGMADLVTAAGAKVTELEARRAGIAGEVADVEAKVLRIREKLPGISARERSIDPDQLLAELQLMTGELLGDGSATLEAEMRKLEGDAASDASLAALKAQAEKNP
jgi:phage shock protein A